MGIGKCLWHGAKKGRSGDSTEPSCFLPFRPRDAPGEHDDGRDAKSRILGAQYTTEGGDFRGSGRWQRPMWQNDGETRYQ